MIAVDAESKTTNQLKETVVTTVIVIRSLQHTVRSPTNETASKSITTWSAKPPSTGIFSNIYIFCNKRRKSIWANLVQPGNYEEKWQTEIDIRDTAEILNDGKILLKVEYKESKSLSPQM